MRRWMGAALGLAIAASACSWSRFGDVESNASVVVLTRPGSVKGFGSALAALADGDRVLVLVAGAPGGANGAAVFSVGQGEQANTNAFDFGQCTGGGCVVGRSAAGLARAQTVGSGLRQACWFPGWGPADSGGELSLIGGCTEAQQNRLVTALAVPAGLTTDGPLRLASDAVTIGAQKSEPAYQSAALVAGSGGKAWLYPPLSTGFVELVAAPAAGDFGDAVAVLRAGGQRRFAVSAPAGGQVFLFDASGTLMGCFSAAPGFGRTLAAGDVDGDGADELVVAGDAGVLVVSGAAVQAASGGSCTPAADSALATLSCRETADVSACPGRFGESIAVGDIDGDGDGEVVVGAPGMTVRGEANGGAVLVFDVEGDHPDFLTEARFVASASSGDRLGEAVVFAPQSSRDLLVAGAPGAAKAMLFHCSKLLRADQRGSRCR